MTTDEVKAENERRDERRNGNPFLYSETLYIGGVYKGDGNESGDHPFILVETGRATQQYMLISLRDGMPANAGGAGDMARGLFGTATERDIRKFLARNNMQIVAADAKTYYGAKDGYDPERDGEIEDYVKSK